MADESNDTFARGKAIFKEVVAHQGEAYAKYGEALRNYGNGKIAGIDLLKTAADLYFGEVGRIAGKGAEAASLATESALSAFGVKTLKEERLSAKKTAKG